jgi:RsiW-degrading membrane proteinase PrsW (M82 family)
MLCIIPVLIFALPIMFLLPPIDSPILYGFVAAFLLAAIPEECCKLLVVRGYSLRQREFDEPMDGIVYGAVASLGFAALENVMYVFNGGLWVAGFRALTAVPAHAFFGVILGYFVGRARFEPELRRSLTLTGLILAILFHGFYDTPLLAIQRVVGPDGNVPPDRMPFAALMAFAALVILLVMTLYGSRLAREQRRAQVERRVPPPVPAASGSTGSNVDP